MDDLESVCAELISGNDACAEVAAMQLPKFGASALKALQRMLKSDEVEIRWWAIRALAGFEKTKETTAILLAFLKDESEDVRQAALMAFCHQPDPSAVSALSQLLADPNPMTSRLASNALVKLGKQATQSLLDVLNSGNQSARLEAVRALAEIKDTQSIPGLMKAIESDSAILQYWAGLGLNNMGVGMLYLKPE